MFNKIEQIENQIITVKVPELFGLFMRIPLFEKYSYRIIMFSIIKGITLNKFWFFNQAKLWYK